MARSKSPPQQPLPSNSSTTDIFNRLSLFNSQRSATLAKMGTFQQTSQPRTARAPEDDLEDEVYDDHLGVGVKDAQHKAREQNREQEALRRKMFGKKRKEEEDRRRREGSSEEEEGRAGLGRVKKMKKRLRVEEGQVEEGRETEKEMEKQKGKEKEDESDDNVMKLAPTQDRNISEAAAATDEAQETPAKKRRKKTENQSRKSKNNKKKNKKKREGAD